VPGELGLQVQLATAEDRQHSGADRAFLEASPLGDERVESFRRRLTPVLQQRRDLAGIAQSAEQQADSDRVRGSNPGRERPFAKRAERSEPGVTYSVDGALRAPAYLLTTQELNESFGFELVKLAVESPWAHPAPAFHVHGIGLAAQLVAVHRAVLGEQAEDDQTRQAHTTTLARLCGSGQARW
jgi:hypothetical protein